VHFRQVYPVFHFSAKNFQSSDKNDFAQILALANRRPCSNFFPSPSPLLSAPIPSLPPHYKQLGSLGSTRPQSHFCCIVCSQHASGCSCSIRASKSVSLLRDSLPSAAAAFTSAKRNDFISLGFMNGSSELLMTDMIDFGGVFKLHRFLTSCQFSFALGPASSSAPMYALSRSSNTTNYSHTN